MRASQMQKGQTVKIDGKLYVIVDYQHVKLGKGGAVYQTKLKSLTDGSIQNVRLRSEETVEEAYLDRRTYEYLYSAGSEHVLMEIKTFDQVTLGDDAFGLNIAKLPLNVKKPADLLKCRSQLRLPSASWPFPCTRFLWSPYSFLFPSPYRRFGQRLNRADI